MQNVSNPLEKSSSSSSSNIRRTLSSSLPPNDSFDFLSVIGLCGLLGYEAEVNHVIGVCKGARTEFELLLTVTSIQSYKYRVRKKHRLQYACITGNLSWFTTLFGITKGSHDILNVRTGTNKTLYHLVCTLPNTDGWDNFFSILRNSAIPISASESNTPRISERVQILTILLTESKLDVNIRSTPANHIAFDILTHGTMGGNHDELLSWWLDHLDCFDDENRNRCLPWLAYANRYHALRNFCLIPTVDLNITTKRGSTALHMAASKGHLNIVDELLKYYPQRLKDLNQQINDGSTALYMACFYNQLEIVHRLGHHPDINLNLKKKNDQTPLIIAAGRGHQQIVEELLTYYPHRLHNLNQQNNDGATAIHAACWNNHLAVVRCLVRLPDIDLNIVTNAGRTPLMVVASEGHADIVEELLTYYPQRLHNLNQQDNSDETALFKACKNHQLEVVRHLCRLPDVDLNIITNDGTTPLIQAACNNAEIVDELLTYYPQRLHNLNQQNNKSMTAIHLACWNNHLESARTLCRLPDINLNIFTNDGRTPLMVAVATGSIDIVDELLSYYPHRFTNLNQQDKDGKTALFFACSRVNRYPRNRLERVQRLCSLPDVNMNLQTNEGHTPLTIAASVGYLDIVNELLTYYPHRLTNLNHQNNDGFTALHLACERKREQIVHRLCGISAVDLSIMSNDGRTPRDIAIEKGYTPIVSILTKAQNRRLLLTK